MAEKPPTKANFPVPPPFYQYFTKDNITKLRELRKEKSTSQTVPENASALASKDSQAIDPATLPPSLRYLLPPPLPSDGKWRTFGAQHDLNAPDPSLEDAGIEVLFPADPSVKLNPQPYLLSLARSLLTTFLALTGVLSEDPTQYVDKVADLKTIVTNMHDLINQYRPHQARETLILMMEERIERLKGEVRSIGEAGEKMEGVFKGLTEEGEKHVEKQEPVPEAIHEEKVVEAVEESAEHKDIVRQRAAWHALDTADFDDFDDDKDDKDEAT